MQLRAEVAVQGPVLHCPHEPALERHAILVRGSRGRWMAVCTQCSETMKWLIREWHAYQIRPSTVFLLLRELEYSRFDAARFVLQLMADRALVRIGLLSRRQVDV